MGALGVASLFYELSTLDRTGHEISLAHNAARSLIEDMRQVPFSEVYARYNSNPNDDPGGPGTASVNHPSMAALTQNGNTPFFQITFPEAPDATGILREDINDPSMGMAGGRDLNGDGQLDGQPRNTDYTILPVRINVSWRGHRGPVTRHVTVLLTQR